jgi:hypothetical protein
MPKEYKVVHFLPVLKAGIFSTTGTPIDKQVEEILNAHAREGWIFESYQGAHAHVKPGCLAGLLGRKDEIQYYDIIIFARGG